MTKQLLVALGMTLTLAGANLRADDKADDKPAKDVTYSGRTLKAWLADLEDSDALIREEAIEVLAQLGATAKQAVPSLEKLLKHENRSLRTRAALALWKIDGNAKPAVTALAGSLRDSGPVVRREALASLAQMGADALPAAPVIIDLLDDLDYMVRSHASTALSRMGSAVMPALLKALEDKEVRLRRNAVTMLSGYLGTTLTKEHLPALTARLKDETSRCAWNPPACSGPSSRPTRPSSPSCSKASNQPTRCCAPTS
jgi:HEAT repeat protein